MLAVRGRHPPLSSDPNNGVGWAPEPATPCRPHQTSLMAEPILGLHGPLSRESVTSSHPMTVQPGHCKVAKHWVGRGPQLPPTPPSQVLKQWPSLDQLSHPFDEHSRA